MKRIRFSEEQIVGVLKEAKAGTKVSELCRRYGMSGATFYTWRNKYAGLDLSETRRLRRLEEENRRLKRVVANQALDILALKDELAKEGYGQSLSSWSDIHESPEHTVEDGDADHQATSAVFGVRNDEPANPNLIEMPNGARREGLGLFVLDPAAGTSQPRVNANGVPGLRRRRKRSPYQRWLRNNAFTLVVVLGLLLVAWHIVKP